MINWIKFKMSQCFGVLMLGLILSVLFGHTVVVAHSSERAPEEKDLPKEKLSESITTTEEISAKEMNGHNVDNGFNAGKIDEKEPNAPDTSESEKPADYAKGSLCVYCKYCKFCDLCDKDCPCKKSRSKPNCDLCKYCKYCYLCTSVCDNFCQPGSFIDTFTSAIYEALPKFDKKMKKEVDDDIKKAKDWIKEYL